MCHHDFLILTLLCHDCTPHIHIDFDMGVNVADRRYTVSCCEGLAMDVLQSLASDLDFDYRLYISPDSTFGAYDTTTKY